MALKIPKNSEKGTYCFDYLSKIKSFRLTEEIIVPKKKFVYNPNERKSDYVKTDQAFLSSQTYQ